LRRFQPEEHHVDQNLSWHVLGTKEDVESRTPFAVEIGEHSIALFQHDGALHAIGNRCNHKGGPLCEGTVTGEYVKCPWHGWEYSVITGKGPTGYDEEQVPTFALREEAGVVSVATPPIMPAKLISHKPLHLLEEHAKPLGAPPRVLGISTTAMDDTNPRFSTSDILLEHALSHAATELHADTQLIKLRELAFRHCEGNYSKAARACTWPCAITERDPTDQLTPVYEGLVHWADVVIVATPIRWGRASSLYFKMTERLNCVQNQVTIADNVLIKNKVAAFIITGGQDNVQEVAGGLLTFWSELGYVFPQFPFIAHTRGWDAEDMETNVRLVRASDALRSASQDLVSRALVAWRMIDEHRQEMEKPMPRGGRKAQRLNRPGEVMA
jgi:nitrite reductase/ring-hydroxylating ferredoxin subunit/multimeric flavodoxin WrbA